MGWVSPSPFSFRHREPNPKSPKTDPKTLHRALQRSRDSGNSGVVPRIPTSSSESRVSNADLILRTFCRKQREQWSHSDSLSPATGLVSLHPNVLSPRERHETPISSPIETAETTGFPKRAKRVIAIYVRWQINQSTNTASAGRRGDGSETSGAYPSRKRCCGVHSGRPRSSRNSRRRLGTSNSALIG